MNYLFSSILVVCFMFCHSSVDAQFGLRGKYNLNTFSEWDDYIDANVNGNTDKLFPSTVGIGLDYWFRLKKYRIEFLPEVHLGLQTTTDIPNAGAAAKLAYYGFNFNTQIYIFDLEGDCDCPTFSKQGPTLNKGLFLNVAPGVLFSDKELSIETIDPAFSSSHLNFKIGVGVGYDIGISDLFTITPMINYNIVPGATFKELENISITQIEVPNSLNSTFSQLEFSLRLGFRPDYVKSYGRRR